VGIESFVVNHTGVGPTPKRKRGTNSPPTEKREVRPTVQEFTKCLICKAGVIKQIGFGQGKCMLIIYLRLVFHHQLRITHF